MRENLHDIRIGNRSEESNIGRPFPDQLGFIFLEYWMELGRLNLQDHLSCFVDARCIRKDAGPCPLILGVSAERCEAGAGFDEDFVLLFDEQRDDGGNERYPGFDWCAFFRYADSQAYSPD